MKVNVFAPEAPGLPPLAWWTEISQIADVDGVELRIVGGKQATRSRIAQGMQECCDVMIWSGHGGPGRLATADGDVSADWLACQLRPFPPGAAVIAACMSGQRDIGLDSITEAISQSGINVIGMWITVEDRAAIVYNTELVRAMVTGASIAIAHRVALTQMIMQYPTMAGSAFLLPGLMNGYGKIEKRIAGLETHLQALDEKWAGVVAELGQLRSMFDTHWRYREAESEDLRDKLKEVGYVDSPHETAEQMIAKQPRRRRTA